jgi:AraC-like DNA-binding protein
MGSNDFGRLFFTTDALRERDRFPAYCEEIVRRHVALDVVERGDQNFRATIDFQRAGALGISLITSTPADYIRTPQLVRDGDDGLIVILCQQDGGAQSQRGVDLRLQAGEGVVCDNSKRGALHATAEGSFWALKIPRSSLTNLLPRFDRFAGATLDRDLEATRLLFGYLSVSQKMGVSASSEAISLHGRHIIDLVALALGPQGEHREIVEERGARAARRIAVLQAMSKLLDDPGLSPAKVAARLAITPRYVHLVLEDTGQSFNEHLLERRLERVTEALSDSRQCHRTITDIAFAAGFSNLSHFNRVFRRRYGATPSEVRVIAQARDNASAAAGTRSDRESVGPLDYKIR